MTPPNQFTCQQNKESAINLVWFVQSIYLTLTTNSTLRFSVKKQKKSIVNKLECHEKPGIAKLASRFCWTQL